MPSGSCNSAKLKCPNNHVYDKINTHTTKTGNRKCKTCHKLNQKKYYKVDSKKLKDRIYNRKAIFREQVNKFKLNCSKCPETNVDCLDFHHVNPYDKVHSVSWMISNGRSWEVIENEISKCIVLCANCHRKLEAIIRKEKKNGICDVGK